MKRKPFLIILDGPMGAGKSTVSELLHKRLHKKRGFTALISLDKLKRIVSDYKMGSKFHLEIASDVGVLMAKEYLNRGFNVVVEKAFTTEQFVNAFIKSLGNKSKVKIYQIEAPFDLRVKRIDKRGLPKGVKVKPSLRKIKRNTEHYNERKYQNAIVFDSSKLTPNQIANKIIGDIK